MFKGSKRNMIYSMKSRLFQLCGPHEVHVRELLSEESRSLGSSPGCDHSVPALEGQSMTVTDRSAMKTDVTSSSQRIYSGRRFSNSSGSSQSRRSGSCALSATSYGALGWKMSTSLPDLKAKVSLNLMSMHYSLAKNGNDVNS
jgi:hypothetical protein